MLDKQTRTLIAQRLNQAEKQREQIRAISLDYPSITIEDAYAVQREWVEMKIAEGRVLKGHKIGLTSKAMQASSQISEPDYGALLDRYVLPRRQRYSHRPLYRSAYRSRAGLRAGQTAARPELYAV
ncbi:2-oxo-hepta-3-ene-1,7-dioic acid hydratase [Klebsiella pneumoniae subsp. pneumoniae]|uniref:2-oxo-hepta-3-ene-1,7-dioic acid hydratase n=1 Tax=Klebsiella pneumoniae subsp. pneumoniae TaxID=72407 RepID=A0A378AKQ8_KLEPN|nr:2-oxo-hepta-3-ene-1,7-dioic acid hydratase [Klebsiella pneumoniae subsp. pneumoniae]